MTHNRIIGSLTLGCLMITATTHAAPKSANYVLQSYVEDFRSDQAASWAVTFGIEVRGQGGGKWHVIVDGKKDSAGLYGVSLKEGFPATPAIYYTIDLPTLHKLDQGNLNALTAMVKEFSTDKTPMDIEMMSGFQPPTADFMDKFIPFTFHFWTRGLPEIVPFAPHLTRETHGAHASVLYYQKGFRSGWGMMQKGDHANKNPNSQVNPFPSMFIALSGKCQAKIGGKTVELSAGEMLFVPAGVKHEFWNDREEPAEFILLMFGEGA